jgi:hypothetical protein
MDPNDARAMKDRHSGDEAQMRRSQQRSAGEGHAPVEAYAQHGAQTGPFPRPAGALVSDYERVLAQERSAWESVKSTAQETMFAAAWQTWRTAVEERDRATRLLINQSLSGDVS